MLVKFGTVTFHFAPCQLLLIIDCKTESHWSTTPYLLVMDTRKESTTLTPCFYLKTFHVIGLCGTLQTENVVHVVALRKLSSKGRNSFLWLTTLIGDWQEQKPFVPEWSIWYFLTGDTSDILLNICDDLFNISFEFCSNIPTSPISTPPAPRYQIDSYSSRTRGAYIYLNIDIYLVRRKWIGFQLSVPLMRFQYHFQSSGL